MTSLGKKRKITLTDMTSMEKRSMTLRLVPDQQKEEQDKRKYTVKILQAKNKHEMK